MMFQFNGNEFYINRRLGEQLLSVAYNLPHDWDMVIIISGDRKVRVGKSVFAMTIAAFLCHIINLMGNKTKFDIEDIYFTGDDLINSALKKPKYSINVYDEGRETLAASKAFTRFQQRLIDFFNEAGQLNHIFIIVAPDFFELKEYMAVGRSELLINVYRKEVGFEWQRVPQSIKSLFSAETLPLVSFRRGFFEFFDHNSKDRLYDRFINTRKKDYFAVKAPIIGDFKNQYPIDKELYQEKKKNALVRFNDKYKAEQVDKNEFRDHFIVLKRKEGVSFKDIRIMLENDYKIDISDRRLRQICDQNKQIPLISLEN